MRRTVFWIRGTSIILVALICLCQTVYAQSPWADSLNAYADSVLAPYNAVQCDTLQTYPYLYFYNWPDTARYHDGELCTTSEEYWYRDERLVDYAPNLTTGCFAVYQHTDEPLHVVGLAFGPDVFPMKYTLYDSTRNEIISDTAWCQSTNKPDFWNNYIWDYVDTSRYKFFVLPGKMPSSHEPLTEKTLLRFKYFDPEMNKVWVNGDFWIGLKGNVAGVIQRCPFILYEDHEPPYRINDVRCAFIYSDGTWIETTLEGGIPELFLIVAPECPDVEGLSAVMDSMGTVDVTWDSVDRQMQWVVEMHGPNVSVIDTVSTNHWHYTGLYPTMAYAVKVLARCTGPDNNVWSDWSGTMQFGNTEAIDVANILMLNLSPNPAKGQVTLAAEGCNEAVTVSVVTTGGVEVLHRENATLPLTLDIKDLAAGLYLVRATTPRGTATRRLVVQ